MSLRQAITTTLGSESALYVGRKLPEKPTLVRRELDIALRFGLGGNLNAPPDLDEIADRVRGWLKNAIDPLSRRDLKFAPLCIWGGANPIAESPELLEKLLARIREAGRRSLIRALAAVYFRYFKTDRIGIRLVAAALRKTVSPDFKKLYELHTQFDVFDPASTANKIAGFCLENEQLPQTVLRKLGLSGQQINQGIGREVYVSGMRLIYSLLENAPSSNVVGIAANWHGEPGTAPYSDGNRILAETLLMSTEGRDLSEDLKDNILDILVSRIGDPRTKSHKWEQMPRAAEVARRWLMRLALRQFLDVVDDVAYPGHWDYRRAFWVAFEKAGAISEAWVAFGPAGAHRAREVFGEKTGFGNLVTGYGRWGGVSKAIEKGHAVLIMKIGEFTTVDWSHNGRCIIWETQDKTSPALYQTKYVAGDLAPLDKPNGGLEQTHAGSNNFAWQRHVADFIGKKTGIKLNDRDFRVH